MKTVYLVRHGKAVSMDSGIPDFERTLMERGENDAELIGERLKELKVNPSLIISSPAPRALASAKLIARQLGYLQKSIRTRKSLYYQEDDALINVINEIDDNLDSIMVIGHNPSFTDFAQSYTKDFKADIPTCGVVGIRFKTNKWKEISRSQGKLKLFVYPEKVKKTVNRKSIKKNLETKLTEQIENVLNELDKDATKKIKKQLRKSSKEITKNFVKNLKK